MDPLEMEMLKDYRAEQKKQSDAARRSKQAKAGLGIAGSVAVGAIVIKEWPKIKALFEKVGKSLQAKEIVETGEKTREDIVVAQKQIDDTTKATMEAATALMKADFLTVYQMLAEMNAKLHVANVALRDATIESYKQEIRQAEKLVADRQSKIAGNWWIRMWNPISSSTADTELKDAQNYLSELKSKNEKLIAQEEKAKDKEVKQAQTDAQWFKDNQEKMSTLYLKLRTEGIDKVSAQTELTYKVQKSVLL